MRAECINRLGLPYENYMTYIYRCRRLHRRLIVRFMGCGVLDFLLLVILNGRYLVVERQEHSGGVVHMYEAIAIAK